METTNRPTDIKAELAAELDAEAKAHNEALDMARARLKDLMATPEYEAYHATLTEKITDLMDYVREHQPLYNCGVVIGVTTATAAATSDPDSSRVAFDATIGVHGGFHSCKAALKAFFKKPESCRMMREAFMDYIIKEGPYVTTEAEPEAEPAPETTPEE